MRPERSESARELTTALYTSDQQQLLLQDTDTNNTYGVSKQVTWCFTPSQPLRLAYGVNRTQHQHDGEEGKEGQ